jgi:hypothetical protein
MELRMRAALLALLVAPACSFDPRGVQGGGDDDGGTVPDARTPADGAPDASAPPDANSTPPDAEPPSCPNGYSEAGYRMINSQVTWAEAVADCADDGAPYTHLVMIEDQTENDTVDVFSSNRDIWLGITDDANEGQWRDLDGQPLGGFQPWAFLEPNNGGIGGDEENCGELYDGGSWNDAACTATLRYVCECDIGL